LRNKNHIITRNTEPRDFLYMPLDGFDNVLSCSYSGNNYGVDWTRFEYRYPIYKDYLSNHLKLK
ncbi:MAG: hypothetical protein II603_02005, partial [Muribaculaceae bacterium]|nr:hypothetical protein [Muribaculaceae bacterium]